jgi:predicted  nucleic acid-binding Zn-ribbon protein
MSGARALASARRRRAQPEERRSNQLPPNSNNANIPPPVPGQQQQKKLNNPAAMLLNHNKVIENLQQVVESLNTTVATQNDEINKKIENLSLDDKNIEFFKTKILNLESEMNTIKKHIVKVQTFAMETNLQCIEMRKKIDSPELSAEDQQTETNEITDLLSNAVVEPNDENEFA